MLHAVWTGYIVVYISNGSQSAQAPFVAYLCLCAMTLRAQAAASFDRRKTACVCAAGGWRSGPGEHFRDQRGADSAGGFLCCLSHFSLHLYQFPECDRSLVYTVVPSHATDHVRLCSSSPRQVAWLPSEIFVMRADGRRRWRRRRRALARRVVAGQNGTRCAAGRKVPQGCSRKESPASDP